MLFRHKTTGEVVEKIGEAGKMVVFIAHPKEGFFTPFECTELYFTSNYEPLEEGGQDE